MTSDGAEERAHPSNVNEALRLLSDAEYFAWCRQQADKQFAALIAKRWPQLVKPRTPRSS